MGTYRNVPMIVEAVQLVPGTEKDMVDLLNKYGVRWWAVNNYGIRIERLTGTLAANRSDWVVVDQDFRVTVVSDIDFRRLYFKVHEPDKNQERLW